MSLRYNVLDALREKRTIHEFSAESLMSCGYAEHGACKVLHTVKDDTPIDEIIERFYTERLSLLPVVDLDKRLIGLITRKNLIYAIAERGF